jgi:hypothetical protein
MNRTKEERERYKWFVSDQFEELQQISTISKIGKQIGYLNAKLIKKEINKNNK